MSDADFTQRHKGWQMPIGKCANQRTLVGEGLVWLASLSGFGAIGGPERGALWTEVHMPSSNQSTPKPSVPIQN